MIVKHANPCGVAVAGDILEAYEKAFKTDPTSAFGGIIAFNRPLDAKTAAAIVERQFVEVIVAPCDRCRAPRTSCAAKKNVRVLETGDWRANGRARGFRFQESLRRLAGPDERPRQHHRRRPQGRHRKSADPGADSGHAVCLDGRQVREIQRDHLLQGQHDDRCWRRADEPRLHTKIAAIKAADEGLDVTGSVMASDAFFPFRDGIDAAAETGISAIIQPGGSMRDDEVIQAANEHGLAMVFTGMRHFRH